MRCDSIERVTTRRGPIMALHSNAVARSLMGAANALASPFAPWWIEVHGHRLSAPSADRLLASALQRFSAADAWLLDVWGSACKPGSMVIDVGSNLGLYAQRAARAVGPSGGVLAIEPSPANAEAAERGFACLPGGSGTVTLHRLAACDHDGKIELGLRPDHLGDHHIRSDDPWCPRIEVRAARLDSIVPAGAPVCAIKMDVQGAEVLALRGASRILRERPDVALLVEFCPEALVRCGHRAEELPEMLRELGFSALLAMPRERRLEQIDDSGRLSERAVSAGYADVIFSRLPEEWSRRFRGS